MDRRELRLPELDQNLHGVRGGGGWGWGELSTCLHISQLNQHLSHRGTPRCCLRLLPRFPISATCFGAAALDWSERWEAVLQLRLMSCNLERQEAADAQSPRWQTEEEASNQQRSFSQRTKEAEGESAFPTTFAAPPHHANSNKPSKWTL